MNFVTDKLLQLVSIEGFAERLLTYEGSVEERLSPIDEPREYLSFEKAVQPLGISGRRFVVVHQLKGIARQGRGPPLTCILAQSAGTDPRPIEGEVKARHPILAQGPFRLASRAGGADPGISPSTKSRGRG